MKEHWDIEMINSASVSCKIRPHYTNANAVCCGSTIDTIQYLMEGRQVPHTMPSFITRSVWQGDEFPSGPRVRFTNSYELLNLRAHTFSLVNKTYIFQCMGKIFCVEFQRYPLKFHIKCLTHTLKDVIFIQQWNVSALRIRSSYAFLKRPPDHMTKFEHSCSRDAKKCVIPIYPLLLS